MNRKLVVALCTVVALTTAAVMIPPQGHAKGCIKGAVGGGLAGHLVHHGVPGAVAGCVIGHHQAARQRREPGATEWGGPIALLQVKVRQSESPGYREFAICLRFGSASLDEKNRRGLPG